MALEIGKANYNGARDRIPYYKLGLKDNQRELTLRIAPPIKDLAKDGKFAVYLKQHFGYTISGRGDKPIPQLFACIERRDQSKNVVQSCPECDETAMRKADLAAREAKLKADGASPEVIEAQLRPGKEWLKSHNCDRKWNLFAKNESGVWGILTISHTCYERFRVEMKRLQTEFGIEDPLGVEDGVWFRFTRTGASFNDVDDSVKAVMVPGAVKGQFGVKTDSLTSADLQALEAMPSLSTLGRKLSYDQISRLVESGGDSTVVKAVFDSAAPRRETSAVPTNAPVVRVDTSTVPPAPPAATPAAPAGTLMAALASGPDLQAQINVLMAQLAAAKAAGAVVAPAPAPTQPVTQPTPSPSVKKSLEMDPDAFIAEYGEG